MAESLGAARLALLFGNFKVDTRKDAARGDEFFAMAKSTKTPSLAFGDLMQRADEFARREPAKAVGSAFGAGFLLNLLPLGAIASMLVGIAFSFVRPALLFLGLLKAFELCRTQPPTPDYHE